MAAVLTAGMAVAVALAVSAPRGAATPGWRLVATYTPDTPYMAAVSATGAENAWALGLSGPWCTGCDLFVSHWNGKKWQTIADWGARPPGIGGSYSNQVTGASVAALAGGRAMIVVASTDQHLGGSWVDAVEWTGTSWSAVHRFAGSPGDVIASGPGDVWAFESGNATPWADHYDGKSWSRVPFPVNVTQASGSAAAGSWVTGTVAAQPARVAVLHWSKGAWRNVALPPVTVPNGDQMMPGLIAPALSPASVWATVRVGPAKGAGHVTTILLHWNGKAWTKVPVPEGLNPGSLASDGHGGAWMTSNVMYHYSDPWMTSDAMYHYSGGRWTHDPVPVKSGYATTLQGDLELIPGTRSVLAAAELQATPVGFPTEGAIVKYGP